MFHLPVLLLLDLLQTLANNGNNFTNPTTQGQRLVCCNGGVPHYYDEQNAADQVQFERVDDDDTARPPDCHVYLANKVRLRGSDAQVDTPTAHYCKCTEHFYGSNCTIKREAQTWNGGDGGQSFKMFLLIAVVPLTFAFLAAIGGLLCRMCCCHIIGFECFNYKWHFGGTKEEADWMEESCDSGTRARQWSSPANFRHPNDYSGDIASAPPNWTTAAQRPNDYGPPPSYETVIGGGRRVE